MHEWNLVCTKIKSPFLLTLSLVEVCSISWALENNSGCRTLLHGSPPTRRVKPLLPGLYVGLASMCTSAVLAKQHMLPGVISWWKSDLSPRSGDKGEHGVGLRVDTSTWHWLSCRDRAYSASRKPASECCTTNATQIAKEDLTCPPSLPSPSLGPP